MAKLPDRKAPEIEIEIGHAYNVVFLEAPFLSSRLTATRVSRFRTTGRRWTMRDKDGSSSFVWENEIIQQVGRKIVVGTAAAA